MSKKSVKDLSEIEKDIRRFLIPALRRLSPRFKQKVGKDWIYPRTAALQNARVDRGLYQCASCKEAFKQNEVVVDHIDPVVPIEGDDYDWNTFINRLFVPVEGLQILCNPCHDSKSLLEDALRDSKRINEREEQENKKKEEKLQKKLAKQKKKE